MFLPEPGGGHGSNLFRARPETAIWLDIGAKYKIPMIKSQTPFKSQKSMTETGLTCLYLELSKLVIGTCRFFGI
jgi:hypothetical protein